MHEHDHAHGLGRRGNRRKMTTALGINVLLLVAGVVGALVFGSVALPADAGPALSDVGAIALGLLAAAMAARPARGRRTFGLQRGEILAALVNGLLLVAVAVVVFVEAIGRLSDPPSVESGGVLAIGLFGLAGNIAATAVVFAGDRRALQTPGGA